MARRRFGQHFLIDRRAPGRIVRALALDADDPVLEIGPGRGALTGPLLQQAERIVAVEVDRDLARDLRARHDESRLHLVVGDVLRIDLGATMESAGFPGRGLVLTGNLPYNISKPIVQQLIRERDRVARAVLMFQREVARRLTARPGGKSFGPLTVLAGLCYEIDTLFDLPPSAFSPRPKVDSTVTRWKRRQDFCLTSELEGRLRRVLALCFARRRRTLRNNLRAAALDESAVEQLLAQLDLDGSSRPETLSPEDFVRLAGAFPAARG